MDSSNSRQIKINPKDLYKISPELILNIILKDGSIIILDESVPSKDINQLLINSKKENNNEKNAMNTIYNYKSLNKNNSINLNITNSYTNNNGKTIEMNDSFFFNQNNYNKETLNKSKNNNTNLSYSTFINNNKENIDNNRMNNIRTQNQSISDFVTEKFQKKFNNNIKNCNRPNNTTTINSEININIKGNNSKNKYENTLLKDFDELLLNFNDRKKGLNNQNKDGSKKKYKFYKRLNCRNKDRLLLDDLSGISPSTKAIKYIGRNEQKNNTTTTTCELITNNNNFNNVKRLSFLKEKTIKRNKSINFCLIKNHNKIIKEIISPPNHLHYTKLF